MSVARSAPASKSDQARQFMRDGDTKAALRIARTFRLGLTSEQRAQIVRAYECMLRPDFYAALRYQPAAEIQKGIQVFKTVIGE